MSQQAVSDFTQALSAFTVLKDFNTGRIKDELLSLPGKIHAKKSAMNAARQALKDAQGLSDEREAALRFEISSEQTEGGKSKFSNAEARAAELTTRKANDPEYIRLQNNVRQAQRELEDAGDEHDEFLRKFQAYGAVSGVIEAEIRLFAELGIERQEIGMAKERQVF